MSILMGDEGVDARGSNGAPIDGTGPHGDRVVNHEVGGGVEERGRWCF